MLTSIVTVESKQRILIVSISMLSPATRVYYRIEYSVARSAKSTAEKSMTMENSYKPLQSRNKKQRRNVKLTCLCDHGAHRHDKAPLALFQRLDEKVDTTTTKSRHRVCRIEGTSNICCLATYVNSGTQKRVSLRQNFPGFSHIYGNYHTWLQFANISRRETNYMSHLRNKSYNTLQQHHTVQYCRNEEGKKKKQNTHVVGSHGNISILCATVVRKSQLEE